MKKIFFLLLGFGIIAFTQVAGQNSVSVEDRQLLDMLEEEKMAGEIYQTLYEKWEHHSFKNIGSAEQRHLERVKKLAESRGLKIPETVTSGATGVFQNASLQKLYHQLLERGNKSLVEALKVGALIEETDIRDLKAAIAGTKDTTAIKLYTALMQGSENHLRAFTRNLDRQGITYAPLILADKDFQAILAGKNNCPGKHQSGLKEKNCQSKKGKGKGEGKGNGKCCASS